MKINDLLPPHVNKLSKRYDKTKALEMVEYASDTRYPLNIRAILNMLSAAIDRIDELELQLDE